MRQICDTLDDDVFDHVGHLGNDVCMQLSCQSLRMNKHCWENNMFVAVMSSDSALLSIPVQSTACMSSNLLAYKDSVDDVLMK